MPYRPLIQQMRIAVLIGVAMPVRLGPLSSRRDRASGGAIRPSHRKAGLFAEPDAEGGFPS